MKCRLWKYLYYLVLLVFGGQLYGQEAECLLVDGPYVLYDEAGNIRVIRVDERGIIQDNTYEETSEGFKLDVVSQKGGHRFQVKLHPVERPLWKSGQREKTLIISDPHGDLECFVSVLRNNGVIGKNYKWKFGKNQVIVIGDVFDRGKDVLPIFWLIYKLEQEAKDAGGVMTFMLGNHEEMVLRGNLKYTRSKYKDLATSLGMEYVDLWHEKSELGRWLRSRNLIQVVGKNLFVHAGLSKEFTGMGNAVTEVNEEMARSIFLPKKERQELSLIHI